MIRAFSGCSRSEEAAQEAVELARREFEIDFEYDENNEWLRRVIEGLKEAEKDLDKLGQLEDIEEELGLDLKVYHRLMDMLYCGEPNIVYVKDKDAVIQVGILEIDYCKKKIIFYKDKNYDEDYIYGFWQYGKNWALTREELKNETIGNN